MPYRASSYSRRRAPARRAMSTRTRYVRRVPARAPRRAVRAPAYRRRYAVRR